MCGLCSNSFFKILIGAKHHVFCLCLDDQAHFAWFTVDENTWYYMVLYGTIWYLPRLNRFCSAGKTCSASRTHEFILGRFRSLYENDSKLVLISIQPSLCILQQTLFNMFVQFHFTAPLVYFYFIFLNVVS